MKMYLIKWSEEEGDEDEELSLSLCGGMEAGFHAIKCTDKTDEPTAVCLCIFVIHWSVFDVGECFCACERACMARLHAAPHIGRCIN